MEIYNLQHNIDAYEATYKLTTNLTNCYLNNATSPN